VKIGEAARLMGTSVDHLRQWEKSGERLPARKTKGGTRDYDCRPTHDVRWWTHHGSGFECGHQPGQVRRKLCGVSLWSPGRWRGEIRVKLRTVKQEEKTRFYRKS
jgi:hypothetical protein